MKLVSYFQKWATFQNNFVLTSLNWFDCAKIMMFVDIWNKQTALIFQKGQFTVTYFCLFTFAGFCRLPAAMVG